jgi:Cu+-exporting ATPase
MKKEDTVSWKVEGMTCSNCALTISKFLEKKGLQNIQVNPISGDLSFQWSKSEPFVAIDQELEVEENLKKGIENLGYKVVQDLNSTAPASNNQSKSLVKSIWPSTHWRRFWFCALFTLPLMLHMIPGLHLHWLMNPWIQMALCLPVFMVGMQYFGKSAWNSLRNGTPNMNVLIATGAIAAFAYSMLGAIFNLGEQYLFFETSATIITLVFLGYWLEDKSIATTQKTLNNLVKHQQVTATMIAYDDQHQEQTFPIPNTQLRSGDLILIKPGDQVPADCKVLSGQILVNESILSGESEPIAKNSRALALGGSLVIDGTARAQVIRAADESALANIIQLVKRAQGEKPPIQLMADKISAVFVPVVLGLGLLTFIVNWTFGEPVTDSLLRAIAVLVIACPCAMGLATPAAVAVGLGRAAKKGILFRNAKTLEQFRKISTLVFDKTGTLTTGDFTIKEFAVLDKNLSEEEFKRRTTALEKYSNHPIAKAIVKDWNGKEMYPWKNLIETKGLGISGVSKEGDLWEITSNEGLLLKQESIATFTTTEEAPTNLHQHQLYVFVNNNLVGWIDVEDEIRPEAKEVIGQLKKAGKKIILLSGDRTTKVQQLANQLEIEEWMANKKPEEKLAIIDAIQKDHPVAMIGDGVNDAPAMAKATVGISIGEASQLAIQTADVVLLKGGLSLLPEALGVGKHTYKTIVQNLFWALFYNVLAIPIAAVGLLNPTLAALVMGFSDVVLAANSVRLYAKKVTP